MGHERSYYHTVSHYPDHPEKLPQSPYTLTPFQVAHLLKFADCNTQNGRTTLQPFSGIGGLATPEGCDSLVNLAHKTIHAEVRLQPAKVSFPALVDIAKELDEPEAEQTLRNVGKLADITVVTARDISSPEAFEKLPLTVQYSLSHLGKGLFTRFKDFVEDRHGTLAVTSFHKPSANYLKAVDETEGDTLMQKINNAFSHPTDDVIEASHQFITVSAIPPHNNNPRLLNEADEINTILNRRIDKGIEQKYARVMVTKAMLREEMKGALYSMVAVGAAVPLLSWLNDRAPDNFAAQAMIKFIPPFIADVVTFWSQLSPWLEGNTFMEKGADFYKKLKTSHRRSALLSLGATAAGSYAAETVTENYGPLAGSVIYSGIPFAVALATTIDTYASLKKKMPNLSPTETIQTMFSNNPAHLGIDIGAAATFATGVGVLGFGEQMHNPLALGLIEGAEEHTIAALFTYLQSTFGQQSYIKQEMRSNVKGWKKARGWSN